MKMERINTQHQQNQQWICNLVLYTDEVTEMRNRLQEIASTNSGNDVLNQVEQFQSQLTIEHNQINNLKQEIQQNDCTITNKMQNQDDDLNNQKLIRDHCTIRIRMEIFERIFNFIRRELNLFLQKTM